MTRRPNTKDRGKFSPQNPISPNEFLANVTAAQYMYGYPSLKDGKMFWEMRR